MSPEERNSARLALASRDELAHLPQSTLERPEVRRAVRSRRVPGPPVRLAQRTALRLGWRPFERDCLSAFSASRRALLGESAADAPPRVLIRVDEFPHARAHDDPKRYGSDAFARFHEILSEAGVPYLLALTPRVSADYLDPSGTESRELTPAEIDLIGRVLGDGVSPALHGLDHRTRHADPRRHSEFSGLRVEEARERVEHAMELLAVHGVHPRVFVPPFNRFDAEHYDILARLFDVVCGGPETVATLGYHRSPLWRGDAVYLPSYVPFYGQAGEVALALSRLGKDGAGLWIPVTLHWVWEAEQGWTDLKRLARIVAPHATSWDVFLDEVDASR